MFSSHLYVRFAPDLIMVNILARSMKVILVLLYYLIIFQYDQILLECYFFKILKSMLLIDPLFINQVKQVKYCFEDLF